MTSVKRKKKLREPFVIRLARLCRIHVPAVLRMHPHNPRTAIFVHMGLCDLLDPHSPKKLVLRPWFNHLGDSQKIERGFFLPAPFDPKKCLNTLTTLHEEVKELARPLVSRKSLLSRHVAERVFPQRRAVAFGSTDGPYTLYSLQELGAAWRSAQDFIFPEDNHHT